MFVRSLNNSGRTRGISRNLSTEPQGFQLNGKRPPNFRQTRQFQAAKLGKLGSGRFVIFEKTRRDAEVCLSARLERNLYWTKAGMSPGPQNNGNPKQITFGPETITTNCFPSTANVMGDAFI